MDIKEGDIVVHQPACGHDSCYMLIRVDTTDTEVKGTILENHSCIKATKDMGAILLAKEVRLWI